MVIMIDCCWAAPSAPDSWSALCLQAACPLQGRRWLIPCLKGRVDGHCWFLTFLVLPKLKQWKVPRYLTSSRRIWLPEISPMPCQMGAFQRLSPAHASSSPSVLAAGSIFGDCSENLHCAHPQCGWELGASPWLWLAWAMPTDLWFGSGVWARWLRWIGCLCIMQRSSVS